MRAETEPSVALDPRALTACLVLLLAPVSRILRVIDHRDGSDYLQHTVLFAVDIALAVLVVQQAPKLGSVIREWRSHLAAISALVLAAALLPAFIAHPGDRGVAAILRLVGIAAFASALSTFRTLERKLVIGTAAGVLALSAAAAVYQRATRGPVGLSVLGEDRDAVLQIGRGLAPFGLFVHPYVQAAWACVAGLGIIALAVRGRGGPIAPLALLVVGLLPIGLTLSRSGALAAALGYAGFAVVAMRATDRRRALLVLGAVGIAIAASVAWNLDGWVSRGKDSVSSNPTVYRGSLIDQARGLLHSDPVLGVGPGNYVLALQDRRDLVAMNPQAPRPVHNVPLLLLVEGGLVAVPGIAALAIAVLRQAWRAGAVGWVLVGTFAPFLLLDHLAWSFPQGLVLTGLWLGLLDLAASDDLSELPTAPA